MGRDDAPNRIKRDVAEAPEDYRKLGRREGEGTQGAQSLPVPANVQSVAIPRSAA